MKGTAEVEDTFELVDFDHSQAEKERDHDAMTNDAGSAQRAIAKSRGNRGKAASSNTSTQKSTGSSYTTTIDLFVALMQKMGIWMYNIFPQLNVAIPIFTTSMSWLQVPAIGWDLALSLPDLERRGWLYWCVILCGLAFPLYIGFVIFTDDGVFRIGSYSTDVAVAERARINSKSESGDSAKEERDLEKEYTDQAKLNALVVFSCSLLLGIIAFLVGVVISDGQIVGLGILLVLFGSFYFGWAHFKLYIFELELTKFNRSAVHAYRSMRVFVCSTVLLLLLRSIYIMTISALCWMIIDSSDNIDRSFQFYVACVLIGPISLSFPYAVDHFGSKFKEKYVNRLQQSGQSMDDYRGWLERFPQREVHASMQEVTIAVMFQPFAADWWMFAWIQLIERALGTILTTCLFRDSNAQLFAAISIEVLSGLLELWVMPFLDPAEDTYNLIWRSIACLVLLTTMLLKFVGESFAMVGDIFLLLLTFAAFCFFVKAMDPPRILRLYRLNEAVKKFRNTKVADDCTDILGKLGSFSEIPSNLDVISLLCNAFDQVPDDISCSEVIRDALNYTQQYRLLLHAEGDASLGEYIISTDILSEVGPLLSLGGSRIIQSVPTLISAYTNVTRVILSDMNLNDDCSISALSSLDHLQYLNLDNNLFEKKIVGLGSLKSLKKLSISNLRRWQGGFVNLDDSNPYKNDSMTCLANDIQALVTLEELDMEGSRFTSGSVSIPFVKYLTKMGTCLCINGTVLNAGKFVLGLRGLLLYTVGFIYNLECCIRQL